MYHFLPSPPPYLTFSLYTQGRDKVSRAAKEETANMLVQRFCGCAMLLHMEITHPNSGAVQLKYSSVV